MDASSLVNYIWPKMLTVKDCKGLTVEAPLVHSQDNNPDKEAHCLYLKVGKTTIGEAFFYLATDKAKKTHYLFITHLQNTTISPKTRTRKFSKVGSALIETVKAIAKEIGISSIKLYAQTPGFAPSPNNDNLVEFYKKMGFTPDKDEKSNLFGLPMIWKT